ncbi:MAG: hypothetical protein ACYDB4_18725 [Candidatus Dormibacteraceae bacterium]
MVERAPSVMKDVSGENCQRRIRLIDDVKAIAPAVGVLLLAVGRPNGPDDPIRLAVAVPLEFDLEVFEVLLRPVQLEPPGFPR